MKTVRRPPYPKWNPGYFPCSSLTPLPLSSRRPSVSFGGFGIRQRLTSIQPSWNGVFSIKDFTRTPESGFKASIDIIPMLGQEARFVSVGNHTNAGMGDFTIELDPTPSEAAH